MVTILEAQDASFLPPLDKCLGGGCRLISWKTAFDALSNLDFAKQSPSLEHFLSDELSIELLSRPLDPFQLSTAQTKSDYETRTASINITPSANGQYDINQVKEDALWLSEEAKIDQVSALRIVILEWQSRPAARILCGYTEEECISLLQSVDATDLGMSTRLPMSIPNDTNAIKEAFNSDNSRHVRLLRVLLSEREYILGVGFVLASTRLCEPIEPERRSYGTQKRKSASAPLSWIASVAGKADEAMAQRNMRRSDFVTAATESLEKILGSLESGSGWSIMDDAAQSFERAFQSSQIGRINRILQLLFVQINLHARAMPAGAVKSWFQFVDNYGFFERFQSPIPDQPGSVTCVQGLVCLISLSIMKLPYMLDDLQSPARRNATTSPVLNVECQNTINQALVNASKFASSIASPAVLAWSIVLQTLKDVVQEYRIDSTSDDDASLYEISSSPSNQKALTVLPQAFGDALQNASSLSEGENAMQVLAKSAVDTSNVFPVISQLCELFETIFDVSWEAGPELHARVALLELLRPAMLLTNYSSEIVHAALAIMNGRNKFMSPDRHGSVKLQFWTALLDIFIHDDDILVPGLLQQSRSRYPCEIAPFLKLSRALTPLRNPGGREGIGTLPLSEATSQFTQVLPYNFAGYEVVREDEDANCIRLLNDLPLFSVRRLGSLPSQQNSQEQALVRPDQLNEEMCIPRGTIGFVISESKPFVVMWQHQHSAIKYLALLLSTVPSNSLRTTLSDYGVVDRDTQADIIDLLATMLSSASGTDEDRAHSADRSSLSTWILEEASDNLDRNQDIITVVSDIFETELSYLTEQRGEGSFELLSRCLFFFRAVLNVMPNRIWPLLARSHLIGIDGSGSKLATIVASLETAPVVNDVLMELILLFDALVTDVSSHVVSRRAPSAATSKRFDKNHDSSTGIPQKVMGRILLTYSQHAISLLQSSRDATVHISERQVQLNTNVLKVLNRILECVFGIDDTNKPEEKLTAAFATAANFIFGVFLESTDHFLITTLLSASTSAVRPDYQGNSSHQAQEQVNFTLKLLNKLLDISMFFDTLPSNLEQRLLCVLPGLVRLYVAKEVHKESILQLLTTLARRSGTSPKESPSILGHLSPDTAKNFLIEIQALNRPLLNSELEVAVWDLLSAVVGNKQQSFATFVVTGDTAKNSLRKLDEKSGATSTSLQDKSLLTTALELVATARSMHNRRAISMLRFISLAQTYSSWVTYSIHRQSDFLPRVIDDLGSLTNDLNKAELELSRQIYAASLMVDIVTMYLYNRRQLGDISFIKSLGPKLSYLRAHGVAIPRYNVSLHMNLKRNFEKQYHGCSLSNFKRALKKSDIGRNFYYAMDFADEVLAYDSAWSSSRNGFSDEFVRANNNLSLVEAQMLLTGSWKSLALELSVSLTREKPLQKYLTNTVYQCLLENTKATLSEAVFENLTETRVELALAVLQRLVSAKSLTPSIKTLVSVTWEAIKASGQYFEIAFVGSNAPYYRSLLQVFLLALQPHTYVGNETRATPGSERTSSPTPHHRGVRSPRRSGSPDRGPPLDDIFILLPEVITEVVGKGFRSLGMQIHEDLPSILPSDFALLTAILHTILHIRDISEIYTNIAHRLFDSNVHRYALALFSWSDRLLVDGDPIFGDLSISFLHEMSNIPQMAIYLATEGILSQLSTAPLLTHLRQRPSGFGPLDHPTRLHSIWTRGVLPICLNVLVAVGEPFAAEATAFLNAFPAQLARAAAAFGAKAAPGSVTLDAAAEVHSLALIALALDQYRASPAAAAVAGGVIPDLAFDRARLREDLEGWVNGRGAALKGSVVPGSEREVELARAPPLAGAGVGSRLEEMVVGELKGALLCLGGNGGAGLGDG